MTNNMNIVNSELRIKEQEQLTKTVAEEVNNQDDAKLSEEQLAAVLAKFEVNNNNKVEN